MPVPAAPALTEPLALAAHDSRELWELLAALQALRAHLWLGQTEQPALGLSVILAVDPLAGEFIVDALREPNALREGARLYFDTQVEGRRLRFECRLAEHLTLGDGPAYRLDEPQLVLDQQRRSAYRVRVPASLRLPAAINERGKMVPARLLDLSSRGCSARIEASMEFDSGEAVRVHLKLSELSISCSATVRHVKRVPGAARLGMEFDIETPADSAALAQAVAKLQRELLRRRVG